MLFEIKLFKFKMAVLAIIAAAVMTVLPVSGQAKAVESPQIVINLPSRTIELYSGNLLVKQYPVAIGKPSTPTPLGNFSVSSKEINPSWYPPDRPGKIVPSGPYNPLGYRWLGFISNTYGIHGTNEPKSIGGTVSNGCVRMFEPDVEELFDLVGYGTPVKIVYDRVKFFIDDSGKAQLNFYPDVYGYGKLTVSAVRKQLGKYALNGFVTDDYLNNLIAKPSKQPVELFKTVELKVNGKIQPQRGVIAKDSVYIPVNPVADSLKTSFSVDGGYIVLNSASENLKIPAIVSDGMLYVTEDNLQILFGGHKSWQDGGSCFSFDKINVFYNNDLTGLDVRKVNKMLSVPVEKLAGLLNRTGKWDEASQVFYLENSENPLEEPTQLILEEDIYLIDSEPFIKITKINEHFQTFVYWNDEDSVLELIYPIP